MTSVDRRGSAPGRAGLRRYTRAAPPPEPPPRPVERCELCGVALDDRHGHLVEVERRSLACACRACYLLFTQDGAGGGRYKAVPDRVRFDPDRRLTDADWYDLQIPVTTAFFFTNSVLDRVVACYPSPAGATECELDLASWQRLTESQPLFGAPVPDVEAIFVTRGESGLDAYLIPIDACYALIGEIRLCWRGLDGGDEVRATMATFVAGLRARGRPLKRGR